jgi:hypothetical protein
MKTAADGELEHEAKRPRLEGLGVHYGQSALSDVTLVLRVGDESESIPAHRIVLASESKYFSTLFLGPWDDSSKGEINISLADADERTAFKLLLRSMYTLTYGFAIAYLPCAWRLADYYQCERALEFIGLEWVKHDFDTEQAKAWLLDGTLVGDLRLAKVRERALRGLTAALGSFVTGEVLTNALFLSLPQPLVLLVLAQDDLVVRTENDVWAAMNAWHRARDSTLPLPAEFYDVLRMVGAGADLLYALMAPEGPAPQAARSRAYAWFGERL